MSEAILPTPSITQEEQQTKEWTPAKVIYVFLMAFNLLSHVWLLLTFTGINMPIYIWIPRIAAAVLATTLGKLWKGRGFQILSVYTLLFSLRAIIPDPVNAFYDDVSESILSALWLFAGCYGLARILTIKQLKRFLLICSIIWTISMSVLCCLGIYVVWTEQPIKLLGGDIHLFYDTNNPGIIRLELVYLATVSGAMISTTILIGTILALSIKGRFSRIALFLMLIPIIIALALTDSRTAYISVSIGLAIMVFSGAFQYCQLKIKRKTETDKKTNWKSWLLGIIIMIVAFVLFILVIMQITPAFNHIRAQGIIPKALAEEAEKTTVATRGFLGDRILTGRSELWTRILDYFKDNDMLLLRGESKRYPLWDIAWYFGHCHCLYLQVLLESGIPGLLLILSFIIHTAINAVRAITNPELPLWIRLLPAIITSLLVADLVECFLWLRASYAPMTTVFFISAGILNTLVPKKPKKKSLPEPAV